MNNRDEIKWAPFESLFKSKNIIKELEKERNKKSKPILSSDSIEEIEKNILRAYHTKEKVKITYYYQGIFYEKKGSVSSLCKNTSKIYLDTPISLYFDQIIKVEFI